MTNTETTESQVLMDPTIAAERTEIARLVRLEHDGIVQLRSDFPYCRSCFANLDDGGHFRGCGNSCQYVNEPRTIGWPGAGEALGFSVDPAGDDVDWVVFGPQQHGNWPVWAYGPDEGMAWKLADDYATNALLALFAVMGANRRDWTE